MPLIGGALYAALELGGGLAGLFPLARAEALLFLALRPWLLVLAVAAAAPWPWRLRFAFYGTALALAAASETILLLSLGAVDPWREMVAGLAAGAGLALAADVLVQALRRWRRRLGTLVGAVLLVALLASGLALRPYEALVLGDTAPAPASAPKPPLLVMTSLPVIWGAGGAFDPNSRPSESYRLLEREFAVRPIDAIKPDSLRGASLMLLAQPRLLAPEELVALDDWVRQGGRILILTDPKLEAASELPLLDVRRPPEVGLLGPLLGHWGLRLEPTETRWLDVTVARRGAARRLAMLHPGRFAVSADECRVAGEAWLARCRIGRGEALLVADADLLMEAAWTEPDNPRGSERHRRTADNPLIVADWLDQLAGSTRERSDRSVQWLDPAAGRRRAVLLAAFPTAFALALALALLYLGRQKPTTLSTGLPTENNDRTDDAPVA